jgi:hypothetical protein
MQGRGSRASVSLDPDDPESKHFDGKEKGGIIAPSV